MKRRREPAVREELVYDPVLRRLVWVAVSTRPKHTRTRWLLLVALVALAALLLLSPVGQPLREYVTAALRL